MTGAERRQEYIAGKRLKVIMQDVIERFGMDAKSGGDGGGSNALNS